MQFMFALIICVKIKIKNTMNSLRDSVFDIQDSIIYKNLYELMFYGMRNVRLKQESYTYISNCFDTIFDTTEVSIERGVVNFINKKCL